MSFEKILKDAYDSMVAKDPSLANQPAPEPEVKSPRYTHDCTTCQFLGGHKEYDLYYCENAGVPMVIARNGNEQTSLLSGKSSDSEPLIKARQRANSMGLVTELVNPESMPERIKLTKSALNDFIVWSTSRYNDYLGLGTKKQNVAKVYNSIKNGFYTDSTGFEKKNKTIFNIRCSSGAGEDLRGRNWRLKGRSGDYEYQVHCGNKTITGIPSRQQLRFL